jgi:hypothetical protein
MRFIFILKSAGPGQPTPELMEAMHELASREVAAGRMIQDGGLAPPDAGAQVRLKSGKLVVMDGPFAETKEVIGGFALFELPDLAAAKASAEAFLSLHQRFMPGFECVMEIRQVAGSQVDTIRGS